MRLALIAARLPPANDGVGDHADRLARTIAVRGHDVVVLSAGSRALAAEYAGVRVGETWNALATVRAIADLAERRPDGLVVEYTPFLYGARSVAAPAIVAFARTLRIPVAVVAHEAFYGARHSAVRGGWRARVLAGRDRATLVLATRVLVTGEDRARTVAAALPAIAQRLAVVRLGANVEPGSDFRRMPATPAFVVAFGVVMQRRRLELAIDALAHLAKLGQPVSLAIVGRIYDESYAAALLRRAGNAGIGGLVTLHGELEPCAISALFAKATAAIHTAEEGAIASSGSLLALLAHGLPVVVARTAHDDPLFGGAVHAAAPHADALASALRPLVHEPLAGVALGAAALARYRTEFGWGRAADGVLDAFSTGELRDRLAPA